MKVILPDHQPSRFPLPMFGLGPNTAMPQVAVGGELTFAGRSFADFSGVSVEDLDQVLSSSFGVQIDLLIGMPTFRQMRTWSVDYPRRRMWIDWLEDEDAQNETP